jgi:hypothetical protein
MASKVTIPPVLTQYFPFMGGLDEVTPPVSRSDGDLRYGINVEIGVHGGYATCVGYERYSGQAKPSSAAYAVLPVTLTQTVSVGDVLTDNSGLVFGTVIAVPGVTSLVLTKITGSFAAGVIKVGATVVGAATASQTAGGALTPALDVAYMALAANVYRALVQQVPGDGPILGVHQYKGHVYAFRNAVGMLSAAMFVDSASGWVPVALGREIKFGQRSSIVTITIAAPGVITWNGNGLTAGQAVTLGTTGVLPAGFLAGVTYYVIAPAANTFQLSATLGGTAITTTGTQSGVHTAYLTAIEIAEGDIVTGATSGATATVKRALLMSGPWGAVPVGSLVFTSVTGAFTSGEGLKVGPLMIVNTTTADTAIILLPNGRYDFKNYNFGGQAGTRRMYGCDGVNRAFEFDGTIFAPINTGVPVDAPTYLEIHKNSLFLSFKSSAQYSGPGSPFAFSPIFGAGELTCGDDITDMLTLPGSETSGALALKTNNSTFVLYGNNEDDYNLVQYSDEVGCEPFTMQLISGVMSYDTSGLSTLSATQKFGNFTNALASDKITPFLNGKVGISSASCIVRKKNQYRIFFKDGDAVFVTYAGDKMLGMTTMTFPHDVTCISSLEGASGREEIYFGSSDGFVRQAEIGTSFDGMPINWLAYLTYNHFKGPRQLKTFRKAVLEVTGLGYAELSMTSSIGYGSPEFAQVAAVSLSASLASSYWDQFTWDAFVWDGQSLSPAEGDLYGTAENMSLLMSGYSDAFQPITLNSAIIHYTQRRLLR